jgi:uncharacterized membrane protein
MSRPYDLTTRWHLDAPIERVWEALAAIDGWPRWWRYVESVVTVRTGDANGVGAVHRCTWSSPLGYRLSFDMTITAVARPHCVAATARGALNGSGRWRLDQEGPGTRVEYAWRVTTGPRWMNACAPLLRPLYRWNHDAVMAAGGRGLARELASASLAHDTSATERPPHRW